MSTSHKEALKRLLTHVLPALNRVALDYNLQFALQENPDPDLPWMLEPVTRPLKTEMPPVPVAIAVDASLPDYTETVDALEQAIIALQYRHEIEVDAVATSPLLKGVLRHDMERTTRALAKLQRLHFLVRGSHGGE